MKRLAKRDSPAVSGPRRASPSQSWPGFFFRQRADLSFEWITREVEKLFSATAKSRLASPAQFWAMVHPADLEPLRHQLQSCAKSRQWLTHTFRLRQAGGQVIYISESRRALRDGGAKLCGYEGFWIDITRQTFAEARLLQSVWKETLGDLTPGLAHDFNNVLTGILTLSEAFLAQIDSKHTFHEGLSLIKQKALEASRLTHRIARLHQEKTGR